MNHLLLRPCRLNVFEILWLIGFMIVVTSTRLASAQIQDITWSIGTDYPTYIKAGAAGFVDGMFVYAGGTPYPFNSSNDVDKTYGISLENSTWSELPQMPDSLTYFDGVTVGDALYVTGGRSDFQTQAATYRLAHQNGIWNWAQLPTANLNTHRGFFGTLGTTQGKILIAGGIQGSGQPPYTENTTMNSPELLDTNNLQAGWQALPAFPGPSRYAPAIAGVDGKFYLFGGTALQYNGSESDRLSDAMRYDPLTNQWASLPNLPFGLSGADTAVYQDRYIVLVGGAAEISDQDRPQFPPPQAGYHNNIVQVYDTVTSQYTILPTVLPYGTHDIRVDILGDTIYAVGGENLDPTTSHTTKWLRIGQIHSVPESNTLMLFLFGIATLVISKLWLRWRDCKDACELLCG